jgi:hypothetical protein
LDDSPKETQNRSTRCLLQNEKLLNLFVPGVLAARIAELPCFHAFGMLLLVLRRRVVAVLAIAALQRNDFSHDLNPSLTQPSICEGKIVTR